jgi:Asp-tRNA(Asn)/Glu-tRNA(Gln) amidotransferase A subunit family amidase
MPTSRRVSRSRRQFLKVIPTTIAAGAVVVSPASLEASRASSPESADSITSDTLDVAQQIIGVSLPESEREAVRPLVARNLDNYETIRLITIPSETEPAFSFHPPLPPSSRKATTSRGNAAAMSSTRTEGAKSADASTRPVKRTPARAIEDLAFAPVTELAPLLESRRVSSTELTNMYLTRLKQHDPKLHCVVTLTEELALTQAAEADAEIRAGRYRGPLHGVPYGIKDLFAVKGVLTTWGAKPYANQKFDYDSTAVARLREAGAVLLAKLSTGELAVGDLWFRARTRNPWNTDRGSSGSSAGPASAASAGLVGFAVGTETGGSIVSPASTCGVVGLRPTYGRISRYGCMTLRWTLDKVGPLTRSVADAALILEALHGPDGRDETVPDLPFGWAGRHDVKGLKIGYVESEIASAGDAEERPQAGSRKPIYEAAMELYRKAGATLVPITLPEMPSAAIYSILNAEAGAMFDDLVRSGAINELADKGVNGRANQLRASRFIPAVEYIRAQRVRTLLMHQMNAVFDSVDLFLSPSQSDSVTTTNLTGHPAVVVPGGFVDGLPVAIMLTGRLWEEATLLRAAAAFESATDWHTKRPPI